MSLSPHFSRGEVACRCGCGFDSIDVELLRILEFVRLAFNKAVIINSGCRCREYNEQIGGSKNSQHTFARAADFRISGVDPETITSFLDNSGVSPVIGLAAYENFVHVDSRGHESRWAG